MKMGAARSGNEDGFRRHLEEILGPDLMQQPSVPYNGEIHFAIEKERLPELAGKLCRKPEFTLIQLAATDEREHAGCFKLYYTFASGQGPFLIVVSTDVNEAQPSFPSITPVVPAAHWYEREIHDLFGLKPVGHPDARRLCLHRDWPEGVLPMRRDFRKDTVVPRVEGLYPFGKVEGDGVFQIPVGPIHAGIIEPGHFRFSAVGENILSLEARLFYTHRGIEKQVEGMTPERGLLIAERICGACSFSHSLSYCEAVEKIAGVTVPPRASFIRTVGAELERLYNHIGDTGNICAGVGFSFGTMHGARLKETVMRLNESVFGSRFLRGINTPGGVRRDISEKSRQDIIRVLVQVQQDFRELTDILLANDSFMDRVEGTGILRTRTATDLHAVGPAARASGVDTDTRRDLPYAAYDKLSFHVPVYQQGDVLARLRVRIDETFESIHIIMQALDGMPATELATQAGPLPPFTYSVAVSESPRGENVHFVMSGADNTIFRHMVRSASYCNWPVLPTTVPGNIVPDFPLINKSFELCYSCLDR